MILQCRPCVSDGLRVERQGVERRYRKVDVGKKERSVWSSQALENAKVAPARAAMDWDTIRKQKDEFAELKWKGESQERGGWSGLT